MGRLEGKVVMVTGAARGLGRAIAERCAREGAALALVDVLEPELTQTVQSLRDGGTEVLYGTFDITRAEDIAGFIAKVQAHWGRLHGLVNNAALATRLAGKSFEEIDEATWDRVFEINVKGTWMVTRAAGPLLRAAGGASIVNLASDTALWGGDLFLHYVASKGAIISMTRGLARELGAHKVRVNAIAPGLTPTEATASAPQRRWEQYRATQLLDRDPVPEDIAGVVAFLLSGDGSYMTGQVLAINGGMTFN
jgi:NAD(P)-dependent dehydrogenase (short-subunit alcohol dehydrogenase family)